MSVVFPDPEGPTKPKISAFQLAMKDCVTLLFSKTFDTVRKIIEGCCTFHPPFPIKMSEYSLLFYSCLIICQTSLISMYVQSPILNNETESTLEFHFLKSTLFHLNYKFHFTF